MVFEMSRRQVLVFSAIQTSLGNASTFEACVKDDDKELASNLVTHSARLLQAPPSQRWDPSSIFN